MTESGRPAEPRPEPLLPKWCAATVMTSAGVSMIAEGSSPILVGIAEVIAGTLAVLYYRRHGVEA